jgi:sigma-B regulation protein RsbU (phosphoserine phosphatase)
MLSLSDGPLRRDLVLTHSPFTIGRLADKDLVLAYPYVSRNHAEVISEDSHFYLLDQGSKSGSYVNAQRVQRQRLNDEDVIQIGSLQGPRILFRRQQATAGASLQTLLGQMHKTTGNEPSLGRLGWFVEAARRLNNVGAVNDILAALIETTLQLTLVERGYVFLRDGAGELRLAAGRNTQNELLSDDSTISHSAIQKAIESGSGFIVTDSLSAEATVPSQSMVVQNLRTIVCIPLRRRVAERTTPDAEILGVLYLDSRQQRGKLTRIDNDLLNTIATEAAVLVENAALAQAEETARRYREELRIASEIQQGLMMVRIPELSYARVNARSLPCKGIGGDFYDVIAMEDCLYVVLADISGKGVSAALLGSMLQGLIHAQVAAGQSLAQIAQFANNYICNKNVGKYATLVLLRMTVAGEVEYVNCGHVAPLLHTEQRVSGLSNCNLPVGLIPAATYTSDRFSIQPGERILIVTDGVTEAERPDGDCYGDERLQALVMDGANIFAVLDAVNAFTQAAPLEDDRTILEVCYAAC